jgi:dTDP-4-amino-4,6-dideoxygalactose transaminase
MLEISEVNIPFSKVVCDGRERQLVSEVMSSGWLTTGKVTLEFEHRFGEAVGALFACAVNSCTSALHLALEALGIGPGDEVLVPTWTFTATAEVVRYLGAEVRLIDVDRETALLTPEIVRRAIMRYPKARAIIVVHFAGRPAQMLGENTGILDICRSAGVRVVEDAAHAFPAGIGARPVGSMADVTCFSFYANKTITTGEGGMITTNDEAIHRRCALMRLHGIDRDVWSRFTSPRAGWEYDVVAPGFKYNMPDLNAAIGLAQLERAEELRQHRQQSAERYLARLADCDGLVLPKLPPDGVLHAWHLFSVEVEGASEAERGALISHLANAGIGTSVHYKPIHRLKYYRERYSLKTEEFPNAEVRWKQCLSLPLHSWLTEQEIDYVSMILKGSLALRDRK